MVRLRWVVPFVLLALAGCAREVGNAGPGESCVRAAQCQAGLACVGGQCTSDLSGLEGGVVPVPPMDAGPPPDAGPPVDAGPMADSGPPPMVDSGPPPPDSGTPPADAGRDAGPPPVDAGRDSGPPPVDAGRDSGPPPAPDSGPPPDGG